MFKRIRNRGFNVSFTYHADAILSQDFPKAAEELEEIVGRISIPIDEIVRGGGGEAPVTQRLRRALYDRQWKKQIFDVKKTINERTTFSQSHEVDHIKAFEYGTIALEIEWNNKDPFYDRDLENFNRLHTDGAISIGIIVTRGDTLQNGIGEYIYRFAIMRNIEDFQDLEEFGIVPTPRQRQAVDRYMKRKSLVFAEAWAECFTRDKYGTATTHWEKLELRLKRGVGSPCPIVGIGIPLSCVAGLGDK